MQDMCVNGLKFGLPITWHYGIKDLKLDEMINYIPEGIENAAKITLENTAYIHIWKCEKPQDLKAAWGFGVVERKFTLQWCPSDVLIRAESSPYNCISLLSCSSMWEDVYKKNKFGKCPWERESTTSITQYIDEMAHQK